MSNLDTQPSEKLQYSDQKTFGVVAGRSHVEISPKYGGIFKPSDIIRLEIPAQAMMDPTQFYIHLQTKIYAGKSVDERPADKPNQFRRQTEFNRNAFLPEASRGANANKYTNKWVQFLPGIQSIFSRVRLLAGSVVLEDIQDYNVLYRMMLEATTTEEWRRTEGFHHEGWYDPSNTEQVAQNVDFHAINSVANSPQEQSLREMENPGHIYTFRPLLGLFATGKVLPLKYMGQLTIELYLEQPEECLWSTSSCGVTDGELYALDLNVGQNRAVIVDALSNSRSDTAKTLFGQQSSYTTVDRFSKTQQNQLNGNAFTVSSKVVTDFPNATYTVENVRMHVEFIHPISSFDEQMASAIEGGGLEIYHSSHSTHTRNIVSVGGRNVLSFQERATSLKGGLAVMRNSSSIRQIDCDMSFPANGISSFQWKVGSEYVPSQEVDCTAGGSRALSELQKALGSFGDATKTCLIKQENFLPFYVPPANDTQDSLELAYKTSLPNKFIMALDLEKSPGQQSGFDSAASSVDVELIMKTQTHSSLVGESQTAYPFCGAPAGATFQPTKKWTQMLGNEIIETLAWDVSNDTGHSDKGIVVDHNSDIGYSDNAQNAAVIRHVKSSRGLMVNKNAEVKNGDNNDPLNQYRDRRLLQYSLREDGETARLYFFAHIDQVLRLTGIGRMEIVR